MALKEGWPLGNGKYKGKGEGENGLKRVWMVGGGVFVLRVVLHQGVHLPDCIQLDSM